MIFTESSPASNIAFETRSKIASTHLTRDLFKDLHSYITDKLPPVPDAAEEQHPYTVRFNPSSVQIIFEEASGITSMRVMPDELRFPHHIRRAEIRMVAGRLYDSNIAGITGLAIVFGPDRDESYCKVTFAGSDAKERGLGVVGELTRRIEANRNYYWIIFHIPLPVGTALAGLGMGGILKLWLLPLFMSNAELVVCIVAGAIGFLRIGFPYTSYQDTSREKRRQFVSAVFVTTIVFGLITSPWTAFRHRFFGY